MHSWSLGFSEQRVFHVLMTPRKKVFQIAQRVSPCLLRSGRLTFIAQSPGNVPSIVRIPILHCGRGLWCYGFYSNQNHPTDLSLCSGQSRFDLHFYSCWNRRTFPVIHDDQIIQHLAMCRFRNLRGAGTLPEILRIPIRVHMSFQFDFIFLKKSSNYQQLSVETSNS